MKHLLLVFSIIFAIGCGSRNQSDVKDSETTPKSEATHYDGYKLIWADEFDVDGKPSENWSYEKGFARNEELQWYQVDNATVKNGHLVIEGRKEQVENPNYNAESQSWRENRKVAEYTSSSLTTNDSFTFMYGKVEVRAKIPVAPGSWPAIWLLGNKWEWPNCGEIDMMEYYIKNGAPSILANACWGSNEKWKAVWDDAIIPFTHFLEKDSEWADKFHTWVMDWDEDFIRLYLDDELLNEIDLSKTFNQGYDGNFENPFSNNIDGFGHYILLNLAIGSGGGTPDDAQFPLVYEIDYVRVYQKL
ncbi:MAG: glycoside hydrolase family 16 protein [Bacteroidia bacterium]|nr:glycoside hydrolase family 16 protein [Bacteroidia bacterium]